MPFQYTDSAKRKAQHHQIADAAKKLLGLLNGQSVMDQQAIINRNKAFNIVYQNLLPQRSPSEYDSLLIYQLLKQILQEIPGAVHDYHATYLKRQGGRPTNLHLVTLVRSAAHIYNRYAEFKLTTKDEGEFHAFTKLLYELVTGESKDLRSYIETYVNCPTE